MTPAPGADRGRVPLQTIAREWARIGVIGFGGPPAHINLLRRLCVADQGWLSEAEFEDGVATTGLLPGPASTQLAIYCAWRLRGAVGAAIGGICFIVPGLVVILGLSALFLSAHPGLVLRGASEGSGAAVPAVALGAASALVPASWRRTDSEGGDRRRWVVYAVVGGVIAVTAGPFLVAGLVGCGLAELAAGGQLGGGRRGRATPSVLPLLKATAVGGLGSLAWVAFKVGALSYGGGFVIVPLMQHDAVTTYHWMTAGQFLDAVALGQVTPGPVVQTVAVVGYAAAGIGGGLLAALVAFAPSFAFVIGGAPHFRRLRSSGAVRAFLRGAGPAALGAIAGSAIPLAIALSHWWQLGVTAAAVGWVVVARRGVVTGLVAAGAVGVVVAELIGH